MFSLHFFKEAAALRAHHLRIPVCRAGYRHQHCFLALVHFYSSQKASCIALANFIQSGTTRQQLRINRCCEGDAMIGVAAIDAS